jgi:hypothetical protein
MPHDSETYINQNRCKTITEINSWDLTVVTCHKSCSKNSISFHFEYPFILNMPTINWDIFLINDFPNTSFLHFFLLFVDCTFPFNLAFLLLTIYYLFIGCWFFNYFRRKQSQINLIQCHFPYMIAIFYRFGSFWVELTFQFPHCPKNFLIQLITFIFSLFCCVFG